MRTRPRGPGVAYGALTLALLVLLAVSALTATQPPPPTIAEFAPQAVENITDSPTDQSSNSGKSTGKCAAGAACDGAAASTPSPGPSSLPIDVPRVRRCVGDPPRQIEDPQSPPCVPYWAGNNSGATSKGVTSDSISVAVATNGALPANLIDDLAQFFNKRFEFYGRRLEIHQFKPGDGTAAAQQADAVAVDEQYKAFAAVDYGLDLARGGKQPYYDALAQRRIISVHYSADYSPAGHERSLAPYQWGHFPDLAASERHLAAFTCRGLSGRPARFAGVGSAGKPRKFGIIAAQSGNGSAIYPETAVLEDSLRSCGASLGPTIKTPDFDAGASRNAITQMQAAGVTSILCICNGASVGTSHMASADTQAYYPEWITSDYTDMDRDYFVEATWPSSQAIHSFGITFNNKFLDQSQMPWFWATREVDPGYGGSYDWSHRYYVAFLQLASGIQMAGPVLTPQTLRSGLLRAKFPNPGAGAPPFYQARIDYSDGDPAAQTDGTIIWWNAAERSPVTSYALQGSYCYADLGARYTLNTWPSDDQSLFTGRCR